MEWKIVEFKIILSTLPFSHEPLLLKERSVRPSLCRSVAKMGEFGGEAYAVHYAGIEKWSSAPCF